jgi:hypothetical protein
LPLPYFRLSLIRDRGEFLIGDKFETGSHIAIAPRLFLRKAGAAGRNGAAAKPGIDPFPIEPEIKRLTIAKDKRISK